MTIVCMKNDLKSSSCCHVAKQLARAGIAPHSTQRDDSLTSRFERNVVKTQNLPDACSREGFSFVRCIFSSFAAFSDSL